MYRVARDSAKKARNGGGPSLIEAKAYRPLSVSTCRPCDYRPDGELEEWLKKDPIPAYRQRLTEFGISKKVIDDIEDAVLEELDAATEAAKNGAPPSGDSLMTEVWADGGSSWRN